MTDQEINIAVAEACGYEFKDTPICVFPFKRWFKGLIACCAHGFHHSKQDAARCLPNYCHGLNEMAEAEQTIPHFPYVETLSDVCLGKEHRCGTWTLTAIAAVCKASARQRAEAFLRVKRLWRETEPGS